MEGSASPTSADEVRILPFDADDTAACARVFHRAWNAGHPYAPRVIDEAAFLAAIRDRSVVVARHVEGQVIGFAGFHLAARFIHHLYVDPVWSGRGVGGRLLAHAVALAGGAATLKCQVGNERALRFYERRGWVRDEQGETDGEPWVRLRSPPTSNGEVCRRRKGPAG